MAGVGLIAVTGVTGGLGGRVARRLAERGIRQRVLARDPGRVPALAGAEVVTGSYDRDGLRRAFAGARTLFMVSATEHPDRLELHANVVEAATDAGVERVVRDARLTKSTWTSHNAPSSRRPTAQRRTTSLHWWSFCPDPTGP
jgi:uncharacterized protein YbjT (DUF2867 family)